MGRQVNLFGDRLGLHQFAFLRALAQGLPVLDAAKRYLSVDRLAEARSWELSVGERVAAIARRRGDPRWRLIRLKIHGAEKAAVDAPPPLYEWAEQEGLGDWSEAELQDMYELDGEPVPRVFVSARSGQGLAQLRQMLADRVLQVREEAASEEVEARGDTSWMSSDDDAQH